MRRLLWIGALLFSVILGNLVWAEEPPNCEPSRPGFLQRVGAGRRMLPVRRRPVALVESSLFSICLRPGRLLPQAAAVRLLAGLSVLLCVGTAPRSAGTTPAARAESYPDKPMPTTGQRTGERTP